MGIDLVLGVIKVYVEGIVVVVELLVLGDVVEVEIEFGMYVCVGCVVDVVIVDVLC